MGGLKKIACAGVSDGLKFGQWLISKVFLKFLSRSQFRTGVLDFLRHGSGVQ